MCVHKFNKLLLQFQTPKYATQVIYSRFSKNTMSKNQTQNNIYFQFKTHKIIFCNKSYFLKK